MSCVYIYIYIYIDMAPRRCSTRGPAPPSCSFLYVYIVSCFHVLFAPPSCSWCRRGQEWRTPAPEARSGRVARSY